MKDIKTLPSLIIWHGTVGLNDYIKQEKNFAQGVHKGLEIQKQLLT